MKCENAFTKVQLYVCSAKEIICKICKYKGHIGRLSKAKGRRPVVINVEQNVNDPNCSYSPEDPQVNTEENFYGVINAWTQEQTTSSFEPFTTTTASKRISL